MKLSSVLLPSIYALDGATSHLGGCVWPETGVLGNKMTFADDPYAKFNGKDKSGLDYPYAEGDEVNIFVKNNIAKIKIVRPKLYTLTMPPNFNQIIVGGFV